MTRVFFVLAFAGVALSAAAMGLLRLLPYRNSEVGVLIDSGSGCVSPCFLGIRPGETSVDDAVALLEDHPWVGEVYALMTDVDWMWNGQQPALFDTGSTFFQGRIDVDGDTIETIAVRTHLRNGDLRLALGEPDRIILMSPDEPSWRTFVYIAVYERYELYLLNFLTCAVTPETFWNAPTDVTFLEPELTFVERLELTHLPDWFFRRRDRGCV